MLLKLLCHINLYNLLYLFVYQFHVDKDYLIYTICDELDIVYRFTRFTQLAIIILLIVD